MRPLRHTTASEEEGRVEYLPEIENPNNEKTKDEQDLMKTRNSLIEPKVDEEDTLAEQEASQAALAIESLISEGYEPGDVMVLARKRKNLSMLRSALRQRNIASLLGEKQKLIDTLEAADLIALLDVLVSTQHDLSLARALKSPVFELQDDALLRISMAAKSLENSHSMSATWWDALPNVYPDIANQLRRWQTWVQSMPPHDALSAIYHDGDILARYAASTPHALQTVAIHNLKSLLLAALNVQGGRYLTSYAFIRALKSGAALLPNRHEKGVVQMLTIHGAKGLEAPVVLLLSAGKESKPTATMGSLVVWPGASKAPETFAFMASDAKPAPNLVAAHEAEKIANAREEQNALYVALTRAQSRIIVSGVAAKGEAGDTWYQRIAAHATPFEFEKELVNSEIKNKSNDPEYEKSQTTLLVLPKLEGQLVKDSNTCQDKHEQALQLDKDSHTNKATNTNKANDASLSTIDSLPSRIGQAMHRVLEWDLNPKTAVSSVIKDRLQKSFSLSPEQSQQAIQMAQRIRTGEGAWAWDAAQIVWAGNEVELYHHGQTLRIDRLVQRRNQCGTSNTQDQEGAEWWVLDYKSASNPQIQTALIAQLTQYRNAVQELYPEAPVKAAFLTADGRCVEVFT